MPSTTADRPISPIAAGPRPGRVLNVDARFPRTWPVPDLDQDTAVFRPEHQRARLFPVGCRLPRRTFEEVRTTLASHCWQRRRRDRTAGHSGAVIE